MIPAPESNGTAKRVRERWAERFHAAPTEALGIVKNILNQSFNLDQRALIEMEASAQAISMDTDFYEDATERFLEKKPLPFTWGTEKK